MEAPRHSTWKPESGRSRRGLVAGLVTGTVALATLCSPTTSLAHHDRSLRPPHPGGPTSVEHYADAPGHRHGFAFYSGAPSGEIEKRLPPGVELAGCLEHRVPQQDPAPGTADVLIDVRETVMVERPELGVLRSAVVMTCVRTPADWPQQESAGPPFADLGLPSAPHVLILESWVDSVEWRESMERFGFRPKPATIDIQDIGPTWAVAVSEPGSGPDEHVLHGIFPLPRATGHPSMPFAGCAGVQQTGWFFEWDREARAVAGVRFHSAMDAVGATAPNRKIWVCPGSTGFAWHSDPLLSLIGPPLPATLAGSEPLEVGTFQRWEISRYKLEGKHGAPHATPRRGERP